MARIHWNEAGTAPANARTHLPALAEDYFRAGRKLIGGKHPPGVMHKFRLKTKHFRYTLELFREIYGPGLERRLELLKPVQDALGDLNDCVTAQDLPGGDTPEIVAYLDKRIKKKIAEFEEYWTGTFDAPGQLAGWLNYLAAYAGRKAPGRQAARQPKQRGTAA